MASELILLSLGYAPYLCHYYRNIGLKNTSMKKHNKHSAHRRRFKKPEHSFVIKRQEGMSELHRQAIEALRQEAERRKLAGETIPAEKSIFVKVNPFVPTTVPSRLANDSPASESERLSARSASITQISPTKFLDSVVCLANCPKSWSI